MNKKLAIILTLALLALGCVAALAEGTVRTTGDVYLRTGPGRDYRAITSVPQGTTLDYLGETRADERPVDWYKVRFDGYSLWVSSRYAKLSGASSSSSVDDEEDTYGVPSIAFTPSTVPVDSIEFDEDDEGGINFITDVDTSSLVELSGYYLTDLAGTARALGLENRREEPNSELRYFYSNDALVIGGNDVTEHFSLTGEGYSLYGVYVGMDVEAAKNAMSQAGLTPFSWTTSPYFQHPASENSVANVDGYDSGISLMTDDLGHVTEISWNSYTG